MAVIAHSPEFVSPGEEDVDNGNVVSWGMSKRAQSKRLQSASCEYRGRISPGF